MPSASSIFHPAKCHCFSTPTSRAKHSSTPPTKRRSMHAIKAMAKEVYFNHDGATMMKLKAGVDLLANLVGVTLGPKGRNVVLHNKFGPPKIVNDGVTVCKEIELEDPLESIGARLVRHAAAKTHDVAGDGTTTSIILAQGLITEGLKVIAAGVNPIQVARGIERTANELVAELKLMSRKVEEHELADVAAVSAGNDPVVGTLIADALGKVGWNGVVTIEKGRCVGHHMEIVEGMQYNRGYLSPYFVTDREKMLVEYYNCKLLLVDNIITSARDVFNILEDAIRAEYPIVIIAEDIEEEALAIIIRNKRSGILKVVASKAPKFGKEKSQWLDDIAILTGGTVIRDEMGYTVAKAGKDFLGSATRVVITNDSTLIVTDGSTRDDVNRRVAQIRAQIENAEEKFDKKILSERVAKLSGRVAIIQVGAHTEIELKDRKLRVEDALHASKAAIDEGIVVGGGCSLLRLSMKIDKIKGSMENKEQEIGAEIFRRALAYPIKLIAKNAGVNGNVVVEKVLASDDTRYGYNAAKDQFEDLISAGIIDPSKVVRCCLVHAASVAKVFLTSGVVIADIKEPVPQMKSFPPDPLRNIMQMKPPVPMRRPGSLSSGMRHELSVPSRRPAGLSGMQF